MANVAVDTMLNETTNFNPDSLPENLSFILQVVTWITISIGIPLLLMAILALCFLVKNGQVAPVYIINLYICDLILLCCMINSPIKSNQTLNTEGIIYLCGLYTRLCFMVFISLERHLVIAPPLCCCWCWCCCFCHDSCCGSRSCCICRRYHCFKHTIRISVGVSVVVWIISIVLHFLIFGAGFLLPIIFIAYSVSPLVPFPLLIFFLFRTFRALSTSASVPSDEKRRIVAILVLVLLIYALLFLPVIIFPIAGLVSDTLRFLAALFVLLSPLADLLLCVFIKKEQKLWTSACCRRKENNDANNIDTTNPDHM